MVQTREFVASSLRFKRSMKCKLDWQVGQEILKNVSQTSPPGLSWPSECSRPATSGNAKSGARAPA
jgi:hypothetical protein